MAYPHGWSFWTQDECKALKNRRTDHFTKIKVKSQGSLNGTTAEGENI